MYEHIKWKALPELFDKDEVDFLFVGFVRDCNFNEGFGASKRVIKVPLSMAAVTSLSFA